MDLIDFAILSISNEIETKLNSLAVSFLLNTVETDSSIPLPTSIVWMMLF